MEPNSMWCLFIFLWTFSYLAGPIPIQANPTEDVQLIIDSEDKWFPRKGDLEGFLIESNREDLKQQNLPLVIEERLKNETQRRYKVFRQTQTTESAYTTHVAYVRDFKGKTEVEWDPLIWMDSTEADGNFAEVFAQPLFTYKRCNYQSKTPYLAFYDHFKKQCSIPDPYQDCCKGEAGEVKLRKRNIYENPYSSDANHETSNKHNERNWDSGAKYKKNIKSSDREKRRIKRQIIESSPLVQLIMGDNFDEDESNENELHTYENEDYYEYDLPTDYQNVEKRFYAVHKRIKRQSEKEDNFQLTPDKNDNGIPEGEPEPEGDANGNNDNGERGEGSESDRGRRESLSEKVKRQDDNFQLTPDKTDDGKSEGEPVPKDDEKGNGGTEAGEGSESDRGRRESLSEKVKRQSENPDFKLTPDKTDSGIPEGEPEPEGDATGNNDNGERGEGSESDRGRRESLSGKVKRQSENPDFQLTPDKTDDGKSEGEPELRDEKENGHNEAGEGSESDRGRRESLSGKVKRQSENPDFQLTPDKNDDGKSEGEPESRDEKGNGHNEAGEGSESDRGRRESLSGKVKRQSENPDFKLTPDKTDSGIPEGEPEPEGDATGNNDNGERGEGSESDRGRRESLSEKVKRQDDNFQLTPDKNDDGKSEGEPEPKDEKGNGGTEAGEGSESDRGRRESLSEKVRRQSENPDFKLTPDKTDDGKSEGEPEPKDEKENGHNEPGEGSESDRGRRESLSGKVKRQDDNFQLTPDKNDNGIPEAEPEPEGDDNGEAGESEGRSRREIWSEKVKRESEKDDNFQLTPDKNDNGIPEGEPEGDDNGEAGESEGRSRRESWSGRVKRSEHGEFGPGGYAQPAEHDATVGKGEGKSRASRQSWWGSKKNQFKRQSENEEPDDAPKKPDQQIKDGEFGPGGYAQPEGNENTDGGGKGEAEADRGRRHVHFGKNKKSKGFHFVIGDDDESEEVSHKKSKSKSSSKKDEEDEDDSSKSEKKSKKKSKSEAAESGEESSSGSKSSKKSSSSSSSSSKQAAEEESASSSSSSSSKKKSKSEKEEAAEAAAEEHKSSSSSSKKKQSKAEEAEESAASSSSSSKSAAKKESKAEEAAASSASSSSSKSAAKKKSSSSSHDEESGSSSSSKKKKKKKTTTTTVTEDEELEEELAEEKKHKKQQQEEQNEEEKEEAESHKQSESSSKSHKASEASEASENSESASSSSKKHKQEEQTEEEKEEAESHKQAESSSKSNKASEASEDSENSESASSSSKQNQSKSTSTNESSAAEEKSESSMSSHKKSEEMKKEEEEKAEAAEESSKSASSKSSSSSSSSASEAAEESSSSSKKSSSSSSTVEQENAEELQNANAISSKSSDSSSSSSSSSNSQASENSESQSQSQSQNSIDNSASSGSSSGSSASSSSAAQTQVVEEDKTQLAFLKGPPGYESIGDFYFRVLDLRSAVKIVFEVSKLISAETSGSKVLEAQKSILFYGEVDGKPILEDKDSPFTGHFTCPYEKIAIESIADPLDPPQLIDFHLSRLRGQCVKNIKEKLIKLFERNLVKVKTGLRVKLNEDHEFYKERVLNRQDWLDSISALFFHSYTNAYMDALERFSRNVDDNRSPTSKPISWSVRTLSLMIFKGLEFLDPFDIHAVKIIRFFANAAREKFLDSLSAKLKLEELCGAEKCGPELEVNLNDRLQLMALMQFAIFGVDGAIKEKFRGIEASFNIFFKENQDFLNERVEIFSKES